MSYYIKFNGWAGNDVSGTTARLARMFRMDSSKASQAMRKIIKGGNWQFQWPISDEQAKVARSYCRWLGFDLKLIPTKQSSCPNDQLNSNFASGAASQKKITPELLNQLVELTGNVSSAFTIALYKVNLRSKTLSLRHHISLSTSFNPEAEIEFEKGPLGEVAKSKQPFLEEDCKKNPIKIGLYKKKEDLKSCLAIPVIHKNLEGVLFIDSKESYTFPAKQQKILTGLANQMAWCLNQEKICAVANNLK